MFDVFDLDQIHQTGQSSSCNFVLVVRSAEQRFFFVFTHHWWFYAQLIDYKFIIYNFILPYSGGKKYIKIIWFNNKKYVLWNAGICPIDEIVLGLLMGKPIHLQKPF